uniref:Uncharacterized protein n=1 Tax=Leersia perrieri TaxID=77586 RepID=A0A0D9WH46_9ORYZ
MSAHRLLCWKSNKATCAVAGDGQVNDAENDPDDCVEVDRPVTGSVSKYLSLLYVVSEMGAQDLIGGLYSYVKSIDGATTLENVWVTSSRPYLINLTCKKLQMILHGDKGMDHDRFNLAVRSFVYEDVCMMKTSQGGVSNHFMDLRFWISLGFARGKHYHKEPTNDELFMTQSGYLVYLFMRSWSNGELRLPTYKGCGDLRKQFLTHLLTSPGNDFELSTPDGLNNIVLSLYGV